MLLYKISDKEQIAFTSDRQRDFRIIINELGYADETGSLNSNVNIDTSFPYLLGGATDAMIATRLGADGMATYIINDSSTFDYRRENGAEGFLSGMKRFGSGCRFRMRGVIFDGGFARHTDHSIVNSEGKVISFGVGDVSSDMEIIHNFIHRMKMDNGRMLIPIIMKFIAIQKMFQKKKHLITGYVNLIHYLKFMKNPSRKMLMSLSTTPDSDYVIDFSSDLSTVDMKVSEIVDGTILMDVGINGELRDAADIKKKVPEPYALMTLKPVKLKNQKFPFFVVKHKGFPIFVTPMFFNAIETLKSLKGGVNLLS